MNSIFNTKTILVLSALATVTFPVLAQTDRITLNLHTGPRIPLRGSVHPLATRDHDIGPVDAFMPLSRLTLFLKRTVGQQAALDRLLEEQRDPASPNYTKWMSPEEYANRFGASQADIDRIIGWLASEGFHVDEVSQGRDQISFSGTAGQIEQTLRTSIHHYRNGKSLHYANISDPQLPEGLVGLADHIRGLNDYAPRPHSRIKRTLTASPLSLGSPQLADGNGNTFLSPADLVKAYNIDALHRAGLDGSGQRIVIAGQSDFDQADINLFRKTFGLPADTPQKILVGKDPGFNNSQEEANLDLELAGAVAPKASIIYVYAEDAFVAAQYAIDHSLAPAISFSFGVCEPNASPNDLRVFRAMAQKANALGITWIAASGDSGAAACENQNGDTSIATTGPAVDVPASIPEVTGVGGTEFREGSGTYWDDNGMALSYIPEGAWNDRDVIQSGFSASGGGASAIFGKPLWQVAGGVPQYNNRWVPDVAMAASGAHDGYVIFFQGQPTVSGGTSAAAPVFAGVVVLLNQYVVAKGFQRQPGLGNLNPALYRLHEAKPSVFHDVLNGDNVVFCQIGTADCTTGAFGWPTGPGYDPVTGLGSVDAYALLANWSSVGATNPAPSPVKTIDTSVRYRLTNGYVGDGFSLDTFPDNGSSRPFMGNTGNYSRQAWQLTLENNCYRLTNADLGFGRSLDTYSDGNHDPFMGQSGNYSGQCWYFTPVGTGYYRLTNSYLGSGQSLDIKPDGSRLLVMAGSGDYSSQFWKLTKLVP